MAFISPISAVIISCNAASSLGRCLASLAFCEEIIVVDSGSTDDTVALAQAAGARVLHQAWLGYGPQKQFAVDQAAHDWVLCLDSDEVVSDVLQACIRAELAAPRAQAYEVARCNRFLGRWLKHGEGYPDWSLRLFHRSAAHWSDDSIHEKVIAATPTVRLYGDLLHDSAESLQGYLDKQNRYTSLQAQDLFLQGETATIARLLLSPLARFCKFYVLRLGFLDGLPGLVHVCIGCMNSFLKYAKLLALQKTLSS